jgi:hypothetical protein
MRNPINFTLIWLGWLIAAPALSADFSGSPDLNAATQAAPQFFLTAESQAASHPAVKEALAGKAERERALQLAAQLDELDLKELLVWEQIIPTLPNAALAADAREQESAMRLGVLPLLSARQKEYRALELELGRSLLSPAAPSEAAVATQTARLVSIREWSDLVEQAQRQTRTTLDAVHAVALARGAKAGMRLDATALTSLKQIRERRSQVEGASATATAAWEVSREALRQERIQQGLKIASEVAQAAANSERSSDDLRKRAAEASLPASLRELLRVTTEVLHTTARVGGRWASDQFELIDWQGESFLAEPSKVDAADTELAPLLAERRRLATALRASLAARVTMLAELKSLANQRERVLAGAGYLAPSDDQSRTYTLVQRATADAWQQVDELRGMARDIASAEARERALAAELLGVKLEELVLLEEQLQTLAIGRLLDPIPRPADPRLARETVNWRRDVDALQAIDGRWTNWRRGWDERGKAEESDFAALRAVVTRLNRLWAARIGSLARALPQSPADDEISRLTTIMVNGASAQAQAMSGNEPKLRQLREEAEADPVVGGVVKSAGEIRWGQASAGLRELPRLFDQVARLRGAGSQAQVALDRALPATQRLGALMSLSEALGVPWLALGSGQELTVATELGGETYLLEGLGRSAPQLRREREFLVDAPAQFMAVSMNGFRLAQAGSPAGGTNSVAQMLAGNVLTVASYVFKEVAGNWWVYPLLPAGGAMAGALLGIPAGPPGMATLGTAGGSGGLAAMVIAMKQDAIAGGIKGTIKALAADARQLLPAEYAGFQIHDIARRVEQNTEKAVNDAQAVAGLGYSIKRGATAVRSIDLDALRRKGDLWRQSIARGRQTLEGINSRISEETARLMRSQQLSPAQRLDLTKFLREANAAKDEVKMLLSRMAQEGMKREKESIEFMATALATWWGTAVADQLADLNDMTGPFQPYARDLLETVVLNLVAQSIKTGFDQSATSTSPADAQGALALDLNRTALQLQTQGVAQSSQTITLRPGRPSSEKLQESMQIITRDMEEKEKARLDELARYREREKKEKEDKDKKEKDATTTPEEVKTPVKPVTPPVEPDPTKTDPAGPEEKAWYGFDAVISYKLKGASCTQTLSGEAFGTRAEAEQVMRDESDKALRANVSNRSDVALVRRGLYKGPLPSRPTYPGPTGAKAVQCTTVAATTPTPPVTPVIPKGTYEPKGSGQACLPLGQQMEAQCRQMGQDCNAGNCAGGGYSGCALDCPGCGGNFVDYVAWCPLHPSYEPKLYAGLTMFVSEIKACIAQFRSDGKPGRRERGAECQGKAQKKLAEKKNTWVQQTCQARCAQDGRPGVAVLGGARHRCECR